MWLARMILKVAGWKVDITVPDYPKAIICVAPHTSNWDFIIGKLAYASVGRKAGFLMKKAWFFFPMGCLMRWLGGFPVSRRGRNSSSVENIVAMFERRDRMVLAITPEGTRSLTSRWHTGFLNIARNADVPILLGAIDFARKTVVIEREFTPTGNNDADLRAIKDYYRQFTGKHPGKFTAD